MEVAEESICSFPFEASPLPASRNHRRRGFYSCALTILTIAHKAYIKAEEIQGPIGSVAHKLASLASPIAYSIQYQCLSILSFVDDQIRVVENVVESLFPPSTHVFDKIDQIIRVSETLPENFDVVIDQFPMVIHRVPAFNWAYTQLGIGLNFVIAVLTDWDLQGSPKEEKEIVMDVNHDDVASEVVAPEAEQRDRKESTKYFETNDRKGRDEHFETDDRKGSMEHFETDERNGSEYFETEEGPKEPNSLEKLPISNDPQSCKSEGTMVIDKANVGATEMAKKDGIGKKEGGDEKGEKKEEDPVLELFGLGWHAKRG